MSEPLPAHIEERIAAGLRGRSPALRAKTIFAAFPGKGRGKADIAYINAKLAERGIVLIPPLTSAGLGLDDLIHFQPLGQITISTDCDGPDLDPELLNLGAEPGEREPTVAARTLERLCEQWLDEMSVAEPNRPAPDAADNLSLACLLLAREDGAIIGTSPLAKVGQCLDHAQPGVYRHVNRLPWLLVRSYIADCEVDRDLVERVEDLLGCAGSSVRSWFHFVAWMIRPDLDVEAIRPVLLNNLADKLGGIGMSTGLLADLHEDKVELDAYADAFIPDTFEEQYRDRLQQTRQLEWNYFTFNFLLLENHCRTLIWQAARGL